MSRLRIHFIKKEALSADPERITQKIIQIGGINNTGERWMISTEKAIEGINQGTWQLYILENQKEINVKTTISTDGILSLTATGGGYIHNLLDDLPEVSREHSS